MTRKDYNALADAIRQTYELQSVGYAPDGLDARVAREAVVDVAQAVAAVCAADNPRFDRDRFMIACGVPR